MNSIKAYNMNDHLKDEKDQTIDQPEEKMAIPIDEYIEEEADEKGQKVVHKGVYLLPNLFTTAALFAGFYSIVSAMHAPAVLAEEGMDAAKGYFIYSAIAIFVAMIMDGLDGRVARFTNSQSPFGAEYDSLSDMIAFGLAPALLAFQWSLAGAGKIGWMVAFIYVACAALRLARFNVQIGSVDKKYFIGLASPSAAAVVASSVWTFNNLDVAGEKVILVMLILVLASGCLMVSNIKYYSFKNLDFKRRVPFIVILVVVLGFAIIGTAPSYVLLLLFFTYSASGPVQYLIKLRKSYKIKTAKFDNKG